MNRFFALAVVIALSAGAAQAKATYCQDPTTHKRISCKTAHGGRSTGDDGPSHCCRSSQEAVDHSTFGMPKTQVIGSDAVASFVTIILDGDRRRASLHQGEGLWPFVHRHGQGVPQALERASGVQLLVRLRLTAQRRSLASRQAVITFLPI